MDPKSLKELPQPLKKFYRGEPLALGITQILIGIIGILFGFMLHVSYDGIFYFPYFLVMAPYWAGLPFIISGSLSVAAARNPKPSLVKGILGMNMVSTVAAGIGIAVLSLSLIRGQWNLRRLCTHPGLLRLDPQCNEARLIPFNIVCGMMAVFLVFTLLEFCISLSNAVFGCKILCRTTFTETVVVVYQSSPPGNDASLPMVYENVPPDNAISLPAATEDAENL